MIKRLFSIREAVEYSAESRSRLYDEMKKGNLKFVKMGSSRRIEADELDRYIDAKISEAA